MSWTDEQLNKRLHEIVGLCWHEYGVTLTEYYTECIKCVRCSESYWRTPPPRLDFVNTWEGFGILWEFMQKHEQYSEFILFYGGQDFIQKTPKSGEYEDYLRIEYISPHALAKAVVEFFEEKTNDSN